MQLKLNAFTLLPVELCSSVSVAVKIPTVEIPKGRNPAGRLTRKDELYHVNLKDKNPESPNVPALPCSSQLAFAIED
ncbi:hypothetical protein M514_21712 [Trichuris suis]|uniref:Uncharacterized protein n=1 Tax=Trichuris suis TaxID=68888 RepID=A0A085N990_9BILA|nr:hypothetical protein M514_21712 [Trichuris suis]